MIRRATLFLILASALGIAAGAAASVEGKDRFTARQRAYWAFQPVRRLEPPAVKQTGWVRNPIDAFVLARLESKQLTPSPEADRAAWLRRVSLDLTGLPPSIEETDAFLNDRSQTAFEKVVDRLLASPRYGETWARHWLDLARYADSDGFKADATRDNIWRYRDYTIRSFNEDKPYDRFVREQIAGDELWPQSFDARIATGFQRNYAEEYNAQNLRQRRQDTLNDITDTAGAAFLGLTFGCAKCHDHKFDPILQEDYYKLQSFFANVGAVDDLAMIQPHERAAYDAKRAIWERETKPVREQMEALLEPVRKKLIRSRLSAYAPDVQAALEKPAAERTPLERWMVHRTEPFLTLVDEKHLEEALKGENKERFAKLAGELKKFDPLKPGELPQASYMTDIGREAPPTFTLAVGNFEKPVKAVEPGFLTILNVPAPKVEPPAGLETTGRRTALANWIASSENPLTARVMVNRIWQHHFGRGIVATPSDFGTMGTRPTHPELLDWLADEFVRGGWSVKRMHRLIVLSSSYRQSSAERAEAAAIDESDKLLWRYPRRRLDAEAIRDASLAVAGKLDFKMYGPGVYPELPAGMGAPRGGWQTETSEADRNRRSVYIFVRRNSRYPLLEVFDLAGAQETCPRRDVTTTAPQALSLLNGKLPREWSEELAGRVIREAGAGLSDELERAYRLVYSRKPDGWERDTAFTFMDRQLKILRERKAAGEKLSEPAGMPAGMDSLQAAALVDLCQALLNSNEFVYSN